MRTVRTYDEHRRVRDQHTKCMSGLAMAALTWCILFVSLSVGQTHAATPPSPNVLEQEYIKASNAAARGDLEAAEKGFLLIVEHASSVVEGFLNLAVVYELGHKWVEAMKIYKKAEKLHPSAPQIPMNKCVTLLRIVQDGNSHLVPRDAERFKETCLRASKLNKNSPVAMSNVGDMYTLLVEWDHAAKAYLDAVAMHQAAVKDGSLSRQAWANSFNLQRTYSNLANSRSRAGHVRAAVEAASLALQLGPHDPHTLALLGTIRTTGHRLDFATRAIKRRAALALVAGLTVVDESCSSGAIVNCPLALRFSFIFFLPPTHTHLVLPSH